MSLHGYDVSLELGRSGINKVLGCLERSRLWVPRYSGTQTKPGPKGIVATISYELLLTNLRMRPDTEQGQTIESSITLLVDTAGAATADFTLDGQPILNLPLSLQGTASIVVTCILTQQDGTYWAAISFANAVVQHVILSANLTDDVKRMLVNGVEFLMEQELRKQQQDLPLTGLIKLNGSPQGRLDAVILKSHFYRFIPDDSAVGIGIVFAPGGAPAAIQDDLRLTRQANEDLVISLQDGYLNRMLANYLDESVPAMRGGPLFPYARDATELHVRSVVVAVESGSLRVTVRAGWKHTELSLEMVVVVKMVDGRLSMTAKDVRCDAPTWKGVLAKFCLNIVMIGVLAIVNSIAASDADEKLIPVDEYAGGLLIDSTFFQHLPSGLTISSRVKRAIAEKGVITFGYEMTADVKP